MILEDATFEKFGYFPSGLKPQSGKRILMACDKCGKVRIAKKSHYHALCKSCAQKGKHLTEAAKQNMRGPRIVGINEVDLRRMYDVEEMSQEVIAIFYGTTGPTICHRMKEYGIEARAKSELLRIYPINEDFFKEWTNESAWLFGWAVGDGCYTDGYRLRFHIASRDREVLNKFKAVLKSEHPILDRCTWDKIHKRLKYSAELDFNSKILANEIKTLSYADIPDVYLSDFVRGFWEAEGSVYWDKIVKSLFTNSNKQILDYIKNTLSQSDIVKRGYFYVDKNKVWRLTFGVNDSISLYHYLYDNCGDLYLQRKKDRFEELLEGRLG